MYEQVPFSPSFLLHFTIQGRKKKDEKKEAAFGTKDKETEERKKQLEEKFRKLKEDIFERIVLIFSFQPMRIKKIP